MTNYGLYRGGRSIRKIRGNPRAPHNQRKLIVWDNSKKSVKAWIRKWGNKSQKNKYL